MKRLIAVISLLFAVTFVSAQSYEIGNGGSNFSVYEFFTTTDSLNGADTATVTILDRVTASYLVGIQTYVDTIGGHTSITFTLSQANSFNEDHYTVIKTWNTASNIDTVFSLESPAFTGTYLKLEAINATAADSVILRGWATKRLVK